MRVHRLSSILIAATLFAAGPGSVVRVQAAAVPKPAPVHPAAAAGPPRAPDPQLSGLVPEISLSLRNDVSTVSLADLDASGLYRPDRARSPSAFEQIRRRIGRASLTPNQIEALKQESPQAYETYGFDGAVQDSMSPLVMPPLSRALPGISDNVNLSECYGEEPLSPIRVNAAQNTGCAMFGCSSKASCARLSASARPRWGAFR